MGRLASKRGAESKPARPNNEEGVENGLEPAKEAPPNDEARLVSEEQIPALATLYTRTSARCTSADCQHAIRLSDVQLHGIDETDVARVRSLAADMQGFPFPVMPRTPRIRAIDEVSSASVAMAPLELDKRPGLPGGRDSGVGMEVPAPLRRFPSRGISSQAESGGDIEMAVLPAVRDMRDRYPEVSTRGRKGVAWWR